MCKTIKQRIDADALASREPVDADRRAASSSGGNGENHS
jgi:hypothetical protein